MIQFYESGGQIEYSGYFIGEDRNVYGTVETDNSTYITCQQYSFTSSIPDEVIEQTEKVENIIREEYINPDTGKKEILDIEELEEDKENRCTRMRIKSSNKEYNLVRYDS